MIVLKMIAIFLKSYNWRLKNKEAIRSFTVVFIQSLLSDLSAQNINYNLGKFMKTCMNSQDKVAPQKVNVSGATCPPWIKQSFWRRRENTVSATPIWRNELEQQNFLYQTTKLLCIHTLKNKKALILESGWRRRDW